MPSGTVVRVLTSDPAALIDLPHFCAESGHIYLGFEDTDQGAAHFIRKA